MATALGDLVASAGSPCTLWTTEPDLAHSVNSTHRHLTFCQERTLSNLVRASTRVDEVVAGASLVIVAVPSHSFRDVLVESRRFVTGGQVFLSATKGFEPQSCQRMSEVLANFLDPERIGVLSGPNLPADFMQGRPTPLVIAARAPAVIDAALERLRGPRVLPCRSVDLIGVELAGALKNVVAMAVGMVAGLELGDSLGAYVFTVGLREIERLGTALGADPRTFSGLAGLGDLYLTSTSKMTGNRRIGVDLAQGKTLASALATYAELPEGPGSARACCELAARAGITMPLASGVDRVIRGQISAAQMIEDLLSDVRGSA
jgi:glycerol-3-phosphate dehydrogenase (NAD(P)+)